MCTLLAGYVRKPLHSNCVFQFKIPGPTRANPQRLLSDHVVKTQFPPNESQCVLELFDCQSRVKHCYLLVSSQGTQCQRFQIDRSSHRFLCPSFLFGLISRRVFSSRWLVERCAIIVFIRICWWKIKFWRDVTVIFDRLKVAFVLLMDLDLQSATTPN